MEDGGQDTRAVSEVNPPYYRDILCCWHLEKDWPSRKEKLFILNKVGRAVHLLAVGDLAWARFSLVCVVLAGIILCRMLKR